MLYEISISNLKCFKEKKQESIIMREQIDEELKITMILNQKRMKKVRSGQGALLVMSIVLLFMEGIFFIVGGLNLYCLIGMVMNVIVFLSGTYAWDKKELHYVLIGFNIAASVIYIVWNPDSGLLLRIGVVQHFYLAVQMYMFRRLGKEREDLSYEFGYPYFTELASYQMKENEYVPEQIHKNDQCFENLEIQSISIHEKENLSDCLTKDDVSMESIPVMEEIGSSDISEKFENYLSGSEKSYSIEYNRESKINKEPEMDIDIGALEINKRRIKRFKFVQYIIFYTDILFLWVNASNALGEFMNILRDPLVILKVFTVLGVITASIITVTCLENKHIIKYALISFLAVGLTLTLLCFDSYYLEWFSVFAFQMFLGLKQADEQEYLKAQYGYPYFQRSMIKKQYAKNEYVPEHTLNFESRKMDDI